MLTVTLFSIVLNNLLLCATGDMNQKDFMKREHSLIKPYNDDRWDFYGSTMITNNFVRLTPDQRSKSGQIWNKIPNSMFNWEMHVHFKVHGQAGALYGDGLALWYAKERLELGPVFGNRNLFNGIAIFLDTYSNHNGPHGHGHPYISAMVNNGSLGYDHDRDGTHTELAGCTCHFRGVKQETYIAVRYERQKLTVSTDIDGKNTWKSCFSVDHVRLPKGYFFGATAATGDLSDNHDIISIKVYDIGGDDTPVEEEKVAPDSPSADFFAPPRDHVEDVKPTTMFSGWRLLLVILLLVVGGGVCLVVGYSIFAKRYEDRRKRFY